MKEQDKIKALKICLDFENSGSSTTVFNFVSKDVFTSTLKILINSEGVKLYQSKNTCGIASVMFLSSSLDIVRFTQFAIDLYQYGSGVLNKYVIDKADNVESWARGVKPSGNFTGVSLVVVGSIRFVENSNIKFIPGTMDGMTWPSEMKDLSSKVLSGILSLKSSFLLGWRIDELSNKLENKDFVILLYRTSAWSKKGSFFKDSWHYIVLYAVRDLGNEKVELTFWDYGKVKTKEISVFQFYKGVIKTFRLKKSN